MQLRAGIAAMAAGIFTLATVQPAESQPAPPRWGQCLNPAGAPEIYGPTDVNAQSSNQAMAVGLNRGGTLTVLRWPRPSFYDQVKLHTTDYAKPYAGGRPNDGAFLGLAVSTAAGTTMTWLRDWPSNQRYAADLSDAVVTTYRRDDLGLVVDVTDVVARALDVLARKVDVQRMAGSPVSAARLIAFENLNLVVSKHPQFPTQDWCQEEENVDQALWTPELDAIVHTKTGVDDSTGRPSGVAMAMAFGGPSSAHQVGGDAAEVSSPAAALPTAVQDAYQDAADGNLRGNSSFLGQTTGALARDLDLASGRASTEVLIAGASDGPGVGNVLQRARAVPFAQLLADKQAWLEGLLGAAPWPNTTDPAVAALARRALVTLVTDFDPRSATIVASIATQSPYGEDWPRDGAYFDHALDLIGRGDWVTRRLDWLASVQQRLDQPQRTAPLVPPGNWAMNYYADGIVGGPIPWEIDETGYALWTFWDHTRASGDLAALRRQYPAVKAAADFLVACKDPQNGLQCRANEDDNPVPTQSTIGAGPVWLGLTSAVEAARALGEAGDASRWHARADELGGAIDATLFANGAYGGGDPIMGWPVCFRPFSDSRMASNLDAAWANVAPSFAEPGAGKRRTGAYENKTLVAGAKAWRDDPARLARVRDGLTWIATRAATPDTHTMGEVWIEDGSHIRAAVSQPHVWEQVLFYLASLEAWPPSSLGHVPPSCGGVIEALEAHSHATPAPAPASAVAASGPRQLPATGGTTGPALLGSLGVLGMVLLRRVSRPRRGRP